MAIPPQIAFLSCVFNGLSGFIPARLLPDGAEGRPRNAAIACGPGAADALAGFVEAARVGRMGAFVVPAVVEQRAARQAADVKASAVIVADIDRGDPDAAVAWAARWIGPPSLEVASGGITADGQWKRHLYWRMRDGWTELAENMLVRRVLAEKIGGDVSLARPAQVIRVPGSWHFKATPRPVEVLAYRPEAQYQLEHLQSAVRDMPPMPGVPPVEGKRRERRLDAMELRLMPGIRQGGEDGVTRHDALTCVIGYWVRAIRDTNGLVTETQARELAHAFNREVLKPPFPRDRVDRDFNALKALDRRNNGENRP